MKLKYWERVIFLKETQVWDQKDEQNKELDKETTMIHYKHTKLKKFLMMVLNSNDY